jgi:hypothetical protein
MSERPTRPDGSGAAARPARPAHAPAPVPPKKERPLAPVARDASADATDPPGLSAMHIVDDDDAVIIPDLSADRLVPRTTYGAPQSSARGALRSLSFRRTMIPILLTCGLMLPALAGLWFATDPDHIVRGTGMWLPVTFIVLGAVFLLLAVVNMAQVKHLMSGRGRAGTPR